MQKVKITDKFLALIEREKLVSFNELSKEEKEILEFYNFYNVDVRNIEIEETEQKKVKTTKQDERINYQIPNDSLR